MASSRFDDREIDKGPQLRFLISSSLTELQSENANAANERPWVRL